MDAWPLPPQIPWSHFLRLLRRPNPPTGWLEMAADLRDMARRPLLLRWIAQHRACPAHLRTSLLPRLPWKALAAISTDALAHPQAVAYALDKLRALWPNLTTGERRTLALLAPAPMWPLIWTARDLGVVSHLLQHPRLTQHSLLPLLQVPLTRPQAEALQGSRWCALSPVASQVLQVMDRSLQLPDTDLVLGMAAPWIKALEPEDRLLTAARLSLPALRRMTRAWAGSALLPE
jgi:hypothetical protein